MLKSNVEATTTEAEFEERRQADRDRFKSYYASLGPGESDRSEQNPGYTIAREYFEYYLARRPSKTAAQALALAFWVWGRLTGVSKEVGSAAVRIVEETQDTPELRQFWLEVWDGVVGSIIGAHWKDERFEEGLQLPESIADTLTYPTAEAILLHRSMTERMRHDLRLDVVRQSAMRIVEMDTRECPEWVPRIARGCLHEVDNLNLGQDAPQFRVSDLDGAEIGLADCVGKIVLLNFWNTTCPFCPDEFPYIKQAIVKYGDELRVIGVSLDEDVGVVRDYVRREELDWPQVCDGIGSDGHVPKLYNVFGVPTTHIVDRSGRLVGKRVREDEIADLMKTLV
jgi:peroxiredoxin